MDHSFNLNNTNNDNSMMMDEDKGETYVLTRKVDEVTGSQMKEIEVQKMEDDFTIKLLERQYIETKRNLLYTKRKVEEARNKGAEQTETMNQLLEANKAIVEKFDELKRYQTESLLISLNNAEKTYYNWKDKYLDFSNILQMILEKDNYSNRLNEGVSNRKNELNIEIQRQIAQRKKVINDLNEALAQSDKKKKILHKQLNLETFDDNFKMIEEKNKRLIQLKADHESYQRLFKQEVDNLLQTKNNQIQELQNINTNLGLKKEVISKLQLEVSSITKNQSKQNEVLLNAKAKKELILQEVSRNRQISDMTKKSFDENVMNIMNDQEKINAELQAAEKNFKTNEERLQKEFGTLRTAYEEKKKMLKKIETSEEDLKQFRSMKSTKLKELDANCKEKQDKVTKIAEDYAKLEKTESACIQKQSDFDAKIKELQEKINSIQKELNTIEKNENDPMIGTTNARKEKAKPMLQNENKTVDLTGKADVDANNKDNKKKVIKSLTPEKNVLNNWFDSDDSEESDDEFKIQNIIPKKSNSATASQKKPVYDRDWDTQSIDSTNDDNRSQSDKLFDKLFTQNSAVPSKNEDVFKVPHAHMTPIRKKSYSQARKY